MPVSPRLEIEKMKTSQHGGLNWSELASLGLNPEAVIDFSVCTNPYPLPRRVKEAMRNAVINRYPDSEATEFRQALAKKLGVAPENILAGSGTTELIRLIALTYFRPGDPVLILEPTFGEYEVACQVMGAQVLRQRARAEDSHSLKIEETVSIVQQHRPRALFICNPNNPTGQYFSSDEIKAIVNAAPDSLLILDEAYISFVERAWQSLGLIERGNIIILRSMTKDYGLTGLRLGYLTAAREIVKHLHRACPPWNVNSIAQKAGIAALEETDYLEQCLTKIVKAKQYLRRGIERLGFIMLPSQAHFFLVRVKQATAFRAALLKQGILVRDCTSFGLPEYVRIAPRRMADCRKLIATLHALKKQGELNHFL